MVQNKLYFLIAASIQCVCTTAECINDGKTSCTSEHMCYVQNSQGGEIPDYPLKEGKFSLQT